MTRIHEALCLAAVLFAIALLAVLDIIPDAVAQYAPLVMLPWIIRRGRACSPRKA